jgi:sugar-specific transcriptional regulator TrmB
MDSNMKQPLIIEAFAKLELDSYCAELYTILISGKKLIVSDFARRNNINRVRVYKYLLSLRELGLLNSTNKPNDPQILVSLLQNKEKEMASTASKVYDILPELTLDFEYLDNNPKIKIYQGLSQMSTLLLQSLAEVQDEYLWLNESEELNNLFGKEYFYTTYSRRRAKKGIRVRILSQQNNQSIRQFSGVAKEELREVRFLPVDMSSPGTFTIYNNKVIIWNTELCRAYLINDMIISNALRGIFELIWRNAGNMK